MSIRVLIADDHSVLRAGLRALLEREADIEVVGETATGPETVTAVGEISIDVLILDLSMPGLAGPRVAEIVVAERPNVAIVVLTMHEDEYYLQELLRIGARAFVLKRSTGECLLQAIRAAFRGESFIDPAMASYLVSSYVGRRRRRTGGGSRLDRLTTREREVCSALARGHTNAEIAQLLSISRRTVETHRMNILAKLELKSRADLVRFAIDNGLLHLG